MRAIASTTKQCRFECFLLKRLRLTINHWTLKFFLPLQERQNLGGPVVLVICRPYMSSLYSRYQTKYYNKQPLLWNLCVLLTYIFLLLRIFEFMRTTTLPWLVRWACRAGTRDFMLSWLLQWIQYKIFFSSPYTISVQLSSTLSKLGRQSSWVACLFLCVCGVKGDRMIHKILALLYFQ